MAADTPSTAEKIAEYRKAVAGFAVPALVALGVALGDGTVTLGEWVTVAIAALGTSAAVAVVPNRKPL